MHCKSVERLPIERVLYLGELLQAPSLWQL